MRSGLVPGRKTVVSVRCWLDGILACYLTSTRVDLEIYINTITDV